MYLALRGLVPAVTRPDGQSFLHLLGNSSQATCSLLTLLLQLQKSFGQPAFLSATMNT